MFQTADPPPAHLSREKQSCVTTELQAYVQIQSPAAAIEPVDETQADGTLTHAGTVADSHDRNHRTGAFNRFGEKKEKKKNNNLAKDFQNKR